MKFYKKLLKILKQLFQSQAERESSKRLMDVRLRLEERLKGRLSPRLNALAKKAHDPAKQAELLAHLDHESGSND